MNNSSICSLYPCKSVYTTPSKAVSKTGLFVGPILVSLGIVLYFYTKAGIPGLSSMAIIGTVITAVSIYGLLHKVTKKEEKKDVASKQSTQDDLETFYKKNHIITGDEELIVDFHDLILNLKEEIFVDEMPKVPKPKVDSDYEARWVNLEEVARSVVKQINDSIASKKNVKSVHEKRFLRLDVSNYPMREYVNLGLPAKSILNPEEFQLGWVYRVIQALIQNGYLYKLSQLNNYIFDIQA